MRLKALAAVLAGCLFTGLAAHATVMRVLVVESSDVDGYVRAIEQGKVLLKSKGSPIEIRVWRARFAGDQTGTIVVTAELPDLEALAKEDALEASDPEVKAWLQELAKMRKVVSDSVYSELTK
jgi:hypothetical protein